MTSKAIEFKPQRSVVALPATEWNALAAANPFVDWHFLSALEVHHCVGQRSGWLPCPATHADPDGKLQCAAPAYLKYHSHGEFVFDWAWARAAEGAGLGWYPKLLVGAPFSPVPGPRLLGADRHPEAALKLVQALQDQVDDGGLSSAAVNFCSEIDAQVLQQAGWLRRFDWQFHWHNAGYRDFEDFLSRLQRKARKNIRAERRKVAQQGWQIRWVEGPDLSERELVLVERCYLSTFGLYGNRPSLNLAFFRQVARSFGAKFLVCIASRDQRDRACAVFWRNNTHLYGRYWGSLEDTRDLHFEVCYYQGIEYCLANGLSWFEPGAQGEHKIRRGFLPVRTHSFHYIRHPGLRRAIARYLHAESQALMQYRDQLERLNPFAE
ncbi:MAG: GNAT family N-acetyltransferase [Wenzhouxiangella sp.]|nr:GNAT family N-acetyltransferase [Wenzhouxiangella sp.]MCH8478130.1 GNAT family N-acetyltransferase [Wenzhouxiangella sp.]